MIDEVLKDFGSKLVPQNYLEIALDARKSREKKFRLLIEKKKLPENGWEDSQIEEFVNYLSSLDSNNFSNRCGLGEREARIICRLVAKRHYNFGHGLGRSGDLLESQPKAIGSSLLGELTNSLLLDLIQMMGIRSAKYSILVPMATGMTLSLCFLTLKKNKPDAKYILWSRIDQKSCFKSMTTAGLIPIVIDMIQTKDGLATNLPEIQLKIKIFGKENILCIFSTTSCFAPRICDNIIELAKFAKQYNISHIVNNAYGLQSTFYTHQIEQAQKLGNVDLFIQSTDKNLLVPVGGAIISGFDINLIKEVAKTYAGRASSSQTLDVLMTLLSLGQYGYMNLVKQRKEVFDYLYGKLTDLGEKYQEEIFPTKNNTISLAMTLKSIDPKYASELGSMIFKRGVSGIRVITTLENKTIDSHLFQGWGSHGMNNGQPYLTAATSIGVTEAEVDIFIQKLDKCLEILKKKTNK